MNWQVWLMRAARWAHNPPSRRMVYLVFGTIALALILIGVEALGLWPEALTLDPLPNGGRILR
ncbi:MAG: hypothetical protein AAF415_12385 [Pseudomonadota bacterium]